MSEGTILYNVTVKITDEAEGEWLAWMQKDHIPRVMDSQCFISSRLNRLLFMEEEGKTYTVQYLCKDIDLFEKYQSEFALELQNEHKERFKDKFVAFRSLMEIQSEF